MNSLTPSTSRWRAILDGVLILLFILFLAAQAFQAQAVTIDSPPVSGPPAPDVPGAGPAPQAPQVSSITAAALIAAENAALGLPQFTINIPIAAH